MKWSEAGEYRERGAGGKSSYRELGYELSVKVIAYKEGGACSGRVSAWLARTVQVI